MRVICFSPSHLIMKGQTSRTKSEKYAFKCSKFSSSERSHAQIQLKKSSACKSRNHLISLTGSVTVASNHIRAYRQGGLCRYDHATTVWSLYRALMIDLIDWYMLISFKLFQLESWLTAHWVFTNCMSDPWCSGIEKPLIQNGFSESMRASLLFSLSHIPPHQCLIHHPPPPPSCWNRFSLQGGTAVVVPPSQRIRSNVSTKPPTESLTPLSG